MTIAPQLLFDIAPAANAPDLISKFGDGALASPFRSTVPLLALVKDDWTTFAKILALCGLTGTVSLAFEKTVRSPKGKGRPSHTDAMAISEHDALAIEAKWTEPRYETVATRLKRKTSAAPQPQNSNDESRKFVDGWVELLQPHATRPLNLDDFADTVYQMLHRSASACGLGKKPSLAYLHFTSTEPRVATAAHYLSDLSGVHALLGNPEHFPFYLVNVPMRPTAAFRAIERLKKGEAATGRLVRSALLQDVLFEFGDPHVHRIGLASG